MKDTNLRVQDVRGIPIAGKSLQTYWKPQTEVRACLSYKLELLKLKLLSLNSAAVG
jgi:hypothetical protein